MNDLRSLLGTALRAGALLGLFLGAGPAAADKPGSSSIEEPDKESGDQRIELFDNNKGETLCKVKGRVCSKAGTGTEGEGPEATPTYKRRAGARGDWVVDLFGNFKKPAIAGSAQFIFADVEDSKAAKKREVTAMYQVTLKSGNSVSARVRLSGDEGFRVGRTYHAFVVQILAGKEVVLAEGTFALK
ncbi:MAG: hypothetical protein U1A78_31640 [Polyangia bacterium]